MSGAPQETHADKPEDLGFELPEPGATSRFGILAVLGVLVAGGFTFGYLRHKNTRGDTAQPHGDTATKVDIIKPNLLTSSSALTLPGIARAFEETKIYPRTTGYVRRWLVDLGDKVKEGQLIAEIDTPDLDAQLAQARAQLAQAKASVKQMEAQRDYSKSNSTRYQNLADQKLVSGSSLEQTQAQALTDQASVNAAESNVGAMEANVRRLADLQNFSKVTAPFAGTITSRTIDRGALIQDTGTTPMFTLVAIDPIRVFIDVPQTVASSIVNGTDAIVTVREFPDHPFAGKVARSAGALDPDLHTMSTEVDVPNPDGKLMPGMYVSAALTLPVPHKVVEIPATALYSDASGVRVAVVDAANKVKFVPITIERDTGATLWIATGLTGDERIVKIAVPSLVDGDLVEPSKVEPAAAKPADNK
ncbi:MAG: efflux RND transporter periplasmic adaptor subunit [Kofleriaceae bacterium]